MNNTKTIVDISFVLVKVNENDKKFESTYHVS